MRVVGLSAVSTDLWPKSVLLVGVAGLHWYILVQWERGSAAYSCSGGQIKKKNTNPYGLSGMSILALLS